MSKQFENAFGKIANYFNHHDYHWRLKYQKSTQFKEASMTTQVEMSYLG